ncbi:MAG: D-glycero-alpha-D-manno-heptose-1,7-bisphosphate 7-phosphatase [Candidatus Aminicenantales bacterium]
MSRPAVFLDRDGTLIDDTGYPSRFDQIQIFPRSFEAVRLLNGAGLPVVVITNQSGVGRGYLTEAQLAGIHDRLTAAFAAEGARLDAFYYCPHYHLSADPRYRAECLCRKPLPGLGRKAAADLGLDLRRSYMIGDKEDDVKFGRAIGAMPVLVLTGYGRETRKKIEETAGKSAAVASDLRQAVDWILARENSLGI